MKDILLKIIAELEELRANQIVLGQHVGAPPTIAVARETKSLAVQQNREFFDDLRRQVGTLP